MSAQLVFLHDQERETRTCTRGYHAIDTRHDDIEEGNKFIVIFRSYVEDPNL